MMDWSLGVCTWVFGNIPLVEVATGLARLGFDGVELLGDFERYPAIETRWLLQQRGLSVLSLTPLNVDLAHPDSKVREQALDYYRALLDYAAELGAGIVACHGQVGRVRPIASQEDEEQWLCEGIAQIADRAEQMGLRVAIEVLNRYESHLVNTAAQAKALVETIGSPVLGILLDTYHMNIEEMDLSRAIRLAGDRLWLFHVADSNRRAAGRGHIPFLSLIRALDEVGYRGPIVVECTAPGPDPFTPIKGPKWEELVWDEVATSIRYLRELIRVAQEK
jgi:D-psicose/D-tagatose/L-ribulose 3-epimerase